jgi:hydrogenase maturation protease
MPYRECCRELSRFLLKNPDKTILFAGVGNVLRQDDGVGVYISRNIRETPTISALTVEVSIENYIGKINQLNPDILILVDCMDSGRSPGSCGLFLPQNIVDHTFNTHNISFNRLGEFFTMPVYVLGIQPQTITFGENLSVPVQKSAGQIIRIINRDFPANKH